jgi:hypothetical protein
MVYWEGSLISVLRYTESYMLHCSMEIYLQELNPMGFQSVTNTTLTI